MRHINNTTRNMHMLIMDVSAITLDSTKAPMHFAENTGQTAIHSAAGTAMI